MAKCDEHAAGDFQALMQGGMLGLLMEPETGAQNYQALVGIEGQTLGAALEHYFAQSEQLPTLLRLGWHEGRLAGLLLQRMPLGENGSSEQNWEHLQHLFATLGEQELATVDARTVLHRLFHAEQLRLLDTHSVELTCRCSREGISTMLLSLGEAELQDHLSEHREVEVTCEFCGHQYQFTQADIDTMFLAARMQPASVTRH
jgi:molecular chaperone Hsp33